MLQLIISGGQTGADTAALRAAYAVHLCTAGYMPQGWRTERGAAPHYKAMYGLREAPTRSYALRTSLNVQMSDGVLVLAHKLASSGTQLTLKLSKQYSKPCLLVPVWYRAGLDTFTAEWEDIDVIRFIRTNRLVHLMVAGNSESHLAGFEAWATRYLIQIFREELTWSADAGVAPIAEIVCHNCRKTSPSAEWRDGVCPRCRFRYNPDPGI